MTWDLRCGRWQDTLADVECDALIVDAPYSARTHGGQDARVESWKGLQYDGWSPDDVRAFVDSWAPRVRGWFVSVTDDVLAPVWRAAYESTGRYAFAPVPWIDPTRGVRLGGDGPASSACYIMVSRPRARRFSSWGSLPGHYVLNGARGGIVRGGKPAALMRALIRDYTRPGDLVCDPCAGGGTTLLAAVQEGRRAVGSEMDPETHAKAVERIERKLAQADLWAACERVKAAEQTDLL